MWGAFDLDVNATVDTQGNIFLPKVGTIKLLGV
jgi:protein involved in polysaccharide export with SLBB domain